MRTIISVVFMVLLSFVLALPTQDDSPSSSQAIPGIQRDCGNIHSELKMPSLDPGDYEDLMTSPSAVQRTCPVYRAPVRYSSYLPYTHFSIGTPPRTFELVLQTDLGGVILPKRTRTSGAGIQGNIDPSREFNASKSSTYQNDSLSWTGNVESYDFGSDIFNISNLIVRQKFSLGYNRCFWHAGYIGSSGCLGLKPRSSMGKTFMENAISAGQLPKPVFSLILPNYEGRVGEILFGAMDHSRYTGRLAFAMVQSNNSWQFPMSNVTYNNHSLGAALRAYVDITKRATLFPMAMAEALHGRIDGVGKKIRTDYGFWKWPVPCSLKNSSKKLEFTMGSNTLSLPLRALIVERNGFLMDTWCETYIWGWGSDRQDAMLGQSFLESFYMIFDQGPTPQFGLAPLRTSVNEL
ncbi:hypothetical protein BGZ68_001141 [Mortierella alpina]|nr:hypothetical protein BGZ68_001141 [Mortierella alpina]